MEYRDYGFKENPFLDSLGYHMRGREGEWSKIKSILDKFLAESGSRTVLILGDYGYGKSFILEKIVEGFYKGKFKNSQKSLVASIRLAESEPEAKIGWSFVTKIFSEINFEKLIDIAGKVPNLKGIRISSDLENILSALKEEKKVAFEWLIGESLSAADKKEIGVKKILSKSSQAIGLLYDFQKVLKLTNYDNLVVLIDEFEYVVNVYSEKQVTTILHTFKEIYDEYVRATTKRPQSMVNLIFVIAMTPKGWDFLVETEAKLSKKTGGGGITPWMDRIRPAEYTVLLGPLSKSGVTEIIKDRIEAKRLEYKKYPYKTFPFIHPEFFDYIYEISEGNPRFVLQRCELVLDKAIKDEVKEIDAKYSKKILQEFSIVPKEE
jgi:hypothetical protein